MNNPTPDDVKSARAKSSLTQEKAAEAIHQFGSANWRAYERGAVAMHPASWELFLLKTGQHPTMELMPRS